MKENKFDGTKKYSKDKEIDDRLEALFKKHSITPLEAVRHFPIFARRVTIKKFIAHYELFKRTVDLPGDIVELGVFRGLSLMSFANFSEIYNIGDRTKTIYGFDNFKGFTEVGQEDGPDYEQHQKTIGGFNPEVFYEELKEVIEIFDEDRFAGWKPRIKLEIGNIEETVPEFAIKNPGLRISLLHFDVDMYKPTKVALETLFPLVVKGGVVVFDEYGILEWSGESKAVDEYFDGTEYIIKKFPWQGAPGGYIIKK